jgi:Sec-independent protein translocase protein TatA
VGFGTEVIFIFALGALLLGPKKLPAILGQIARAKAQFEHASQNLKSQLDAELKRQSHAEQVNSAEETGAEQ